MLKTVTQLCLLFSIILLIQMFYYFPVWAFPLYPQHLEPQSACPQSVLPTKVSVEHEQQSQGRQEVLSQSYVNYLKIFREQLEALFKKREKKFWTPKEDEILQKVKTEKVDWAQVSKLIPKTNSEICKRRYKKILQGSKKWPKCVDSQIRRLYREKKSKWSAIARVIGEKFSQRYNYTGKMIKERYQFYLRQGILNRQWSVEEDMKLVQQIRRKGKCWKNLLYQFEGRTQLQLKNRFNGTLKLVQKRVVARLKNAN